MFDQLRVDSLPSLRPPSAERSPSRSVSELLSDLLQGLAGMEATRSLTRGRRTVRRYRDAEFQYVEAAVPELNGVEADICVHDGRVYVRVAR